MNSGMRAISRTNLADDAVEAIRSDILGKRWAVGEKLPNEASLSAMAYSVGVL